jgi:hypothetical protein
MLSGFSWSEKRRAGQSHAVSCLRMPSLPVRSSGFE